MPKGSPELTNARKEEIISACKTLYKDMNFKEITIMKIAQSTTFSRASIYNYFETKEEIFLAILQEEYELWVEDLNGIIENNDSMTKDDIAKALASSLEKRELLLKLMSMNHYDMEEKERKEFLYSFFPFIYGIYPYTIVTDKQKRAMETAGVGYTYYSIYDISYTCAKKLLK